MTYPPQPGQPGPYGQHPGQPNPYGQQPGGYPQQGGYPQSGGFPQQGYPQQGFGAPGPGGFPEPPKKSKTPLIAGIATAVVLVAALLVTGFWAPGFFLGDDKENSADGGSGDDQNGGTEGGDNSGGDSRGSGSGDDGGLGGSGTGPDPVVQQFAEALSDLDVQGLQSLACAGAGDAAPTDEAPPGLQFEASPSGPAEQTSDTEASATVEAKARMEGQGPTVDMSFELSLSDQGGWCIANVDTKTQGGGSTPAPGN